MLPTVIRPVVAAASRKLVREIPKNTVSVYLVCPAVVVERSKHQKRQASTPRTVEQSEQASQQRTPVQKRDFRRLRVFCASAARALPAAGLGRALAGGLRHLGSVASFSTVSGLAIGGVALGIAQKGVRRWHAARRSAKRALVTTSMGPAAEVSVVTFNIRGVMDRWPERAPVLKQCLKQADADIVCFQEVLTGEFGQDQALLGKDYQVYECRAALHHLSTSSIAGAIYSAAIRGLLSMSWSRSLLVWLPEYVESWREQNVESSSWSRLARDLAIAPFFGNSIASRLPAVAIAGRSSSADSIEKGSSTAEELLWLGGFRAAQRVCLLLRLSTPIPQQQQQLEQQQAQQQQQASTQSLASPSDPTSGSSSSDAVVRVWLVNTHLDHAAPDVRSRQMLAICDWMEPLKRDCAGIVITGDLNAPPNEDVHCLMLQHGFMSTHKVLHGTEPAHTWPSGIQAPLMDEGDPHCADYIYAWQAPGYQLQVTAAQLCGAAPASHDDTLYPSDHIGIKVNLKIVTSGSGSGSGSNWSTSKGSASKGYS